MSGKVILDACCGGKMFWFDQKNPAVAYVDKRIVKRHEFWQGRFIEVRPDTVADFANLPYADRSFKLVVFDPPHLRDVGETSRLALKYGRLLVGWEAMIHDGFRECIRVLDEYGVLIFKWSEVQIPVSRILDVIDAKPLFGHRSGKASKTHWMCFMKGANNA